MQEMKSTTLTRHARLSIGIATPSDKNVWNAFVRRQCGSIYHHWEWADIISQSLGHTPIFFVARNYTDQIEGIFPLFLKQERGNAMLITLPCIGYTDPLTKHSTISMIMLEHIALWAQKKHILLEMSWSQTLNRVSARLFQHTDNVCFFTTNTTVPYTLWQITSLKSDKKRRLRKAKKMNIAVQTVGKSHIKKFYEFHLHAMKTVGIMAHPLSLYVQTFDHLPDNSLLLQASINGEPKAYLWGFTAANTIYLWKNGYIKGTSKNSVYYDVLIERFIQIACANKHIAQVNFSTAWCRSGLADFKKHWGFTAHPVYVLCSDDQPPYAQSSRDRITQIFIKHCPFFLYAWLTKRNRL